MGISGTMTRGFSSPARLLVSDRKRGTIPRDIIGTGGDVEFEGSREDDMMFRRCLTDICEDGWEADASYPPGAKVFHISMAEKSEPGRPVEIRKTRSQRKFSSLLHFRNQQPTPFVEQASSATGAEILDIPTPTPPMNCTETTSCYCLYSSSVGGMSTPATHMFWLQEAKDNYNQGAAVPPALRVRFVVRAELIIAGIRPG